MKKAIYLFSTVLLLTACQQAITTPPQTFGASHPEQPISIEQALTMRDDSIVVIEGTIFSRVDDDEYIVSDKTGQIQVEIDDDLWQGQQINRQQKLRLLGEIDKEHNRTELKVKQMTLLP